MFVGSVLAPPAARRSSSCSSVLYMSSSCRNAIAVRGWRGPAAATAPASAREHGWRWSHALCRGRLWRSVRSPDASSPHVSAGAAFAQQQPSQPQPAGRGPQRSPQRGAGRTRSKPGAQSLKAAVRRGDVRGAEEALGAMQGPNEEAWGLLAGLYAARGMAPELAALRARMRERCARPGARFFRLLLAGHAEAGDEAAVAAARAEMAAAGLPEGPETFHAIMAGHAARPGGLPRALQVREEMRGAGHEVEGAAFAALIGGAARAGDVEEALALRAEMTALGVPESTRTLTPLVEALLAAGRVAPAANLVRGAPDAAVDGFLYGRLLRAALARGSRALAAELEEEAAARGFGDAEAATAAARAGDLARRGDPEAAERALAQAAARGARLPALPFNTLLDAYAKRGDAAGAERAAGLLERAGARPDAATMNGLVEAHSRAGDLDAALAALRRLQRRGVRADGATASVVVDACGHGGRPEAALALFAELTGDDPAAPGSGGAAGVQENAYTSLVEALCRCGRHAEARAVAARLRAGAAERGAPPGAKLRRTLVSWLLRDGLAGEAEEELQAAREDGLGGDESLAALARMARMDGRPRP